MTKQHKGIIAAALSLTAVLSSCGGDPNSPGMEYMPDMYRSPALEAYVDYGQDPYMFDDSLVLAQRERQEARKPVDGTIPFSMDASKEEFHFPYPYANTPEGYEQAGLGLHSPIPMTEANVEKGKVIYGKFCIHYNGVKGQGDGTVVQNGGYPLPPSYTAPGPSGLRDLPEGKIFHSLTYGKNVAMGSHASQLNKEERWLVVQYVKYLQNGGKMTREGTGTAVAATPTPAAN